MDEKFTNWCLHKDSQEWFLSVGEKEPWITVYKAGEIDKEKHELQFIWSCLIGQESIDEELTNYTFEQPDGYPVTDRFEKNGEISYYSRFGGDGREPLFFRRKFTGKDGYIELSQEFIHFFQLYHDRSNSRYLLISPDGSEEPVIKINDGTEIQISTRRLKQYLAFKGMSLLLGVVIQRFFDEPIGNGFTPSNSKQLLVNRQDRLHYAVWYQNSYGHGDHNLFTELIGKKIIPPMPIEKTGLYPFKPEPKFETFYIGYDQDGNLLEFTCNPEELSDYFGKNKGKPHYLTPIFFRKEVLNKYYGNSAIYSVRDGSIYIGDYILRADTNHPELVMVFLGDLGRDIPFTEQQYWKSFNIPPAGEMSDTAFRRSFLGEWAEPQSEQFKFKRDFTNLQKKWEASYGWPLFKPVNKGDEYRIDNIRIPLSENPQEFDQQVEALVIILIDSINKAEIDKSLHIEGGGTRSIQSLEAFCQSNNYQDYDRFTRFLRDLYDLRSQSASHRKGSTEYPKVLTRWGIDKNGYISTFRNILTTAIDLLNYFIAQLP
jgi:hypothetical protein